jgi:AraC-like DNA-binding protein
MQMLVKNQSGGYHYLVEQKPFYQKHPEGPLDLFHPFAYFDSPMRFYNFHWHSFIEIAYGFKKKIWVSVDGQSHEILPRTLAFINSGSIHGYWGAPLDALTGLLEVRPELFDAVLLDKDSTLSYNNIFNNKTFFSPNEDGRIHRRLEECFLTIKEEYISQKKGYGLAIKSALYEMALVFLRDFSKSDKSLSKKSDNNIKHEVLERIFSFIYKEYKNPGFSLGLMADFAGMSKFYFTRFFRKYTGQTFHDYLSAIRITHAKELLIESNRTILDIALDCGFGSKETFNRLFKRYTGIVPSIYRDKQAAIPDISQEKSNF